MHGKLKVSVVKDEASITLPLLVVKGGGTLYYPPRQRLTTTVTTRLEDNFLFTVYNESAASPGLSQFRIYRRVRHFKKSKVKFHLKDNAKPLFNMFHLPCETESLTGYKQQVL